MNREGMRIIQNDSLRKTIIIYYENHYKLLQAWNDAEWNMQFHDTREIVRVAIALRHPVEAIVLLVVAQVADEVIIMYAGNY